MLYGFADLAVASASVRIARFTRLSERVPTTGPRVQPFTRLLLATFHAGKLALQTLRLHQPMLADLQVIGGAATTSWKRGGVGTCILVERLVRS